MALTSSQDQRLSLLMRQAQDGDKAAYEALLRDVVTMVRGFIEKRLGACEAVEDVMQEILLSIHKARHTYDPAKPFAPWMFAIARFRIADHWRRTFRLLEDEMPENLGANEPRESDMDDSLKTRVAAALNRLPEKQRRVINLLKLEGRSIREAASELMMSEAAVKVTAHRAYKALQQEFENENGYE